MKLFLASLANQTLDRFVSEFGINKENFTIAYIDVAAETYPGALWVDKDKKVMKKMGMQYSHYDFKLKTKELIILELSKYDAIFVTGGNTYYLLNQINLSGYREAIIELLNNGKYYIGSSAGSCVMGPTIDHVKTLDHPEIVPELTDYTALNLVPHLIVPHYGRDKYAGRQAKMKKIWGDKLTFLADNQAIVVNGDKIEIVTNQGGL